MSETKWTPGPWVVVPYHGDTLVICTDDDGDNRVCFMATSDDRAVRETRIAADARLIASAPDLADSLAKCVEHLRCVRLGYSSISPEEHARAVLAKVRGETEANP